MSERVEVGRRRLQRLLCPALVRLAVESAFNVLLLLLAPSDKVTRLVLRSPCLFRIE